MIDVREDKSILFSTYGLDNRTTAAHDTDVTRSLHKVRGADSLVLVQIVLAQQEVAETLQRVVGATSDLSITQE